MTVHAGDEETGLRLAEPGYVLFSTHEIDSLLKIPGTLGFVKERHVFQRGFGQVHQAIVPEVMHVLDEQLDIAPGLTLG